MSAGLPTSRRLLTPSEEIASIRRRLLGVEGKASRAGRMRWRNIWQPGEYRPHDVVVDGDWAMVANKPTTDRAAPQPTGALSWLLPDVPTWLTSQFTGSVKSGIRITNLTEAYAVSQVRVWLPDVSADASYRLIITNNVTGIIDPGTLFFGTILGAPGWLTVPIQPRFLVPGADISLRLVSQKHSATTDFNHPWVYGGSSQSGAPLVGGWTHDNQQTFLRINKTDDDGSDRSAELAQAATVGTIIRTEDEGDPTSFYAYSVLDGVDSGTYWTYDIALSDTGPGGPPAISLRQQLYFEVPIPLPADYVHLTDQWLGDPSLSGLLTLGDGTPVENQDAYGVDIEVQRYEASGDWDVLSSRGEGSSGGGGVEFLNDLFDVDAPSPDDGERLAWDDTAQQWEPRRSVSSLGIVAFPYRFSTSIDATPASGRVQADNADLALATIIHVHQDDEPGVDISLFLESLEAGDWLNLHERTDTDRSAAYDVIGPATKVGDVFHVPVSLYAVTGAPLSNNLAINLFLRFGQGETYGHVIDVNEPSNPTVGLVWVDPDDTTDTFDGTYLRLDGGNVMTGIISFVGSAVINADGVQRIVALAGGVTYFRDENNATRLNIGPTGVEVPVNVPLRVVSALSLETTGFISAYPHVGVLGNSLDTPDRSLGIGFDNTALGVVATFVGAPTRAGQLRLSKNSGALSARGIVVNGPEWTPTWWIASGSAAAATAALSTRLNNEAPTTMHASTSEEPDEVDFALLMEHILDRLDALEAP